MPPKRKKDNLLPTENKDASPTRYLLKIDSFSLLSACGINKYESNEFESCGYKWKLTIFPNGDGDGCNHISMYLAIVGTSSLPANWEVNATISFLLFDQNHDNFVITGGEQHFCINKTDWGISKFMPHATFKEPSNGYLVNNKCVIGVDVYVIKNQLVGECMSSLNVIQPYKHEWKISEFSKLKNVAYSEEFNSGGYKWKLLLCLAAGGIQNDKSISISLTFVDANGFDHQKRVLANYSISFKDQITGLYRKYITQHWFTAGNANWGHAFMPLSELEDPKKGFLVEDCCIVAAEILSLRVVNGLT